MSKLIRRASRARGAAVVLGAGLFMLVGAGCSVPQACVGGIGVCKSTPLRSRQGVRVALVDLRQHDARDDPRRDTGTATRSCADGPVAGRAVRIPQRPSVPE